MPTYTTSDNNYGVTSLIVDATAGNGNYTTIASALTAAVSGQTIFIRPGTYAENPTLKAGVNLCAWPTDALGTQTSSTTVTINGKCTFTGSGIVNISGIQLQTNSDFCLVVSGSSASAVNLQNCFINALNNTAISFTSTGGSSVNLYNCNGNIGTTGITIWVATASTASMTIQGGNYSNSGSSTTASSTSACTIFMYNVNINHALSTSSTGAYQIYNNQIFTSGVNAVALTTAGTGTSIISNSQLSTGTAAAISAGSGTTININNCVIDSTNTNPITGAGTVRFTGISFPNTGVGINTTTLISNTFGRTGTWTPAIAFGGSSTGITYTSQVGSYTQIGNVVFYKFSITLLNKGAQTGNATVTGWPIAEGGITDYVPVAVGSNMTYSGVLVLQISASTGSFFQANNGTFTQLTNTAFANNSVVIGNGIYFTT